VRSSGEDRTEDEQIGPGTAGVDGGIDAVHRPADEEIAPDQVTGCFDRDAVFAKLHAVRIAGEGDVYAVVYEETGPGGRDVSNPEREIEKRARRHVLLAKLDDVYAA
jgi:hypothetical protein